MSKAEINLCKNCSKATFINSDKVNKNGLHVKMDSDAVSLQPVQKKKKKMAVRTK